MNERIIAGLLLAEFILGFMFCMVLFWERITAMKMKFVIHTPLNGFVSNHAGAFTVNPQSAKQFKTVDEARIFAIKSENVVGNNWLIMAIVEF